MKSGRRRWQAIAKLTTKKRKVFVVRDGVYDLIKGSKLNPAPLTSSTGLLTESTALHAI